MFCWEFCKNIPDFPETFKIFANDGNRDIVRFLSGQLNTYIIYIAYIAFQARTLLI